MRDVPVRQRLEHVKGLVLFDGDCGFCSRSIRFAGLLDLQRRLYFSPLSGDSACGIRQRHAWLPEETRSMIFVADWQGDNEKVWIESEAIIRMIAFMGWYFTPILVFCLLPRRFRDGLYRWIARNRYRIAGRSGCSLSSSRAQSRLVD